MRAIADFLGCRNGGTAVETGILYSVMAAAVAGAIAWIGPLFDDLQTRVDAAFAGTRTETVRLAGEPVAADGVCESYLFEACDPR